MPECYLPPDFNLFRYSDRIGGHLYKGTEKKPKGYYGDNLGKAGLRFQSDDERAVRIFKRHYGQELVKGFGNALVVPEVRVYLPYREFYHNFVAGYGAFATGSGLEQFCDGQTLKLKRQKTQYTPAGGKPRDSWAVNKVNQPCPAADSPHPCEECGYVRRLTVYIAELYDEGYRSVFVVNTPAINEISLFHKLADEERRLDRFAPGSNVSFMPSTYASMPDTNCYIRWILKRSPDMIGVPAMKKDSATGRSVPTGKQTQKEEWFLDLEIDPSWWDTAMSRVGKGPYRIDRATGQAICIEDDRLRYFERLASAANTLAAASQSASHFLEPGQRYSLPQAIPVDAIELDPGPGISLNGDEPVPASVADALDVDAAPFRPDLKDPTNYNRLIAVAAELLLTMDDIKEALAALYGDKRSAELAEVHMQKVIDHMLLTWACQMKMFPGMAEAQLFMDSHDRQPKGDIARTKWWKDLIDQRIENDASPN